MFVSFFFVVCTSSYFVFSKKLTDCAGHFGFIKLELPVFHAGYFRHTVILLQCICKQCARILLSEEDRQSFLKRLRGPKVDALIRSGMFKRIVDLCKRTSRCPHCFYANGVVKKVGSGCFKIAHEKYRAKNAEDQTDQQLRLLDDVLKQFPDLKPTVQKSVVSTSNSESHLH